MPFEHHFEAEIAWPQTAGTTTATADYIRDYTLALKGKPPFLGSGPTEFKGNAAGLNPEEMLVASLTACHMLTYLALAARKGIEVAAYEDHGRGTLAKGPTGKLQFVEVTLRPRVRIASGGDAEAARALHAVAHAGCFVGNSVNFPVRVEPEISAG